MKGWTSRALLAVAGVIIVGFVVVRADVTDTPKDGARYEDGLVGTGVKLAEDPDLKPSEAEKKMMAKGKAFKEAIKALRPTQARPCPKVAVHYVDGEGMIAQFAKAAAANNTCAINLYFGHTAADDDASVRDAMKPLNDAPAPAKPNQQSRSGVWGCSSGKYNNALAAGRRVSAAGSAMKPCERGDTYESAATDLAKILSTDAVPLCEACGNAVTIHLYFGKVRDNPEGDENGYASW